MKSVLITGASTGIGEATAIYFAERGWQVYAGVRQAADADRLKAAHAAITPLYLDVTIQEQIDSAAEQIAQQRGQQGLQGLVNNAGIGVPGPWEFLPLDELRRQLEVNFIGQVAITQACLALLRQGGGRIANVSSIGGRIAAPFVGPYSASKFALEAFTDSLRRELAPWDIHVASIQPGAIDTPIWKKSLERGQRMLDKLPQRAQQLYGRGLEAAAERSRRSAANGIAPRVVARSIYHALDAARPRTRYIMGRGTRLSIWLARLLPDEIIDWAVGREFSRS